MTKINYLFIFQWKQTEKKTNITLGSTSLEFWNVRLFIYIFWWELCLTLSEYRSSIFNEFTSVKYDVRGNLDEWMSHFLKKQINSFTHLSCPSMRDQNFPVITDSQSHKAEHTNQIDCLQSYFLSYHHAKIFENLMFSIDTYLNSQLTKHCFAPH